MSNKILLLLTKTSLLIFYNEYRTIIILSFK